MRSWTYFRLILISLFLGACSRNPLGEDLHQSIVNLGFTLSQSCTNSFNQDAPYNCQITSSEVISDLVYSLDPISTTCTWASIDSVTGIISGTPNDDQVGICQIVVGSENSQRRAMAYPYFAQVNNLPATLSIANATSVMEDTGAVVVRDAASVQASEEGLGAYGFDHSSTTAPRCVDSAAVLSVDASTGAVTFGPAGDYAGTCNIRVAFDDGNSAANSIVTSEFSITVNNINDAPTIASIANQSTYASTAINVNLNVNDIDNALSCSALNLSASSTNTAVVAPSGISFSGLAPNCVLTISPVAAALGATNITVTVTDGALSSATSFQLDVVVLPVPPVLLPIANQNGSEDIPIVFAINVSDGDTALACNPTFLSATSSNTALLPVANIAFSGAPPNCNVTLTPTLNGAGSSNITIIVNDGLFTVNQSFTATVGAVNDAPLLGAIGAQAVSENGVAIINFTISDVDNALDCASSMSATTSNASIVPVANIVFGGTLPSCTATVAPVAATSGAANLTFTVNDGALTDFETFVFAVNAVNDAPVLGAIGPQSVNEDGVATINFTISDIDSVLNCASSMSAATSDAATIPVANVVFGGTLPNCTATVAPVANTNGAVNLTFTLTDGALTDFETFAFTVNAVNDAPVLGAIGPQSVNEDGVATINFTISDIDSALNCTSSMSAATSNASIVPVANVVFGGTLPNCTATVAPMANTNGAVNLTFTLTDGTLTDLETFAFTVNAVNDAPVLGAIGPQSVNEDGVATINFTISDIDSVLDCTSSMGAATSNAAVVPVANVVFGGILPNCTATVTPIANTNGAVNLTFTLTDGTLADFETFVLTVNAVNDAPVLSTIGAQVTSENVSLVVNFTISDVDSVPTCSFLNLTATSSNAALIPTANIVFGGTIPNCTATLTPVASQNGTSNISITVADGGTPNLQDVENFVFTVTPFNDPPVLSAIGAQGVSEDGVAIINFTISDVDNALDCTASMNAATSNAAIVPVANVVFSGTLPNCTATVSPVADTSGAVNLTFTVSDSGAPIKTDFETFVFTVNAVNDAPVLGAIGPQSVSEDGVATINFTISDIDSALNCTSSMSAATSNASIVPVANVVFGGALPNCTATVTPVANTNGAVNLTFTLTDGALTDFETFVFIVNAVNDAPVLGAIGPQSVNEDGVATINFTISDIDSVLNCTTSMSAATSDAAIVPVANVVFGGTLPNCTATVTPVANTNGAVNLTFTLTDGALTDFETFNFTVDPVNDAPVLNAISAQSTSEDSVKVINFTISDVDSTLDCNVSMSVATSSAAIVPVANVVFGGALPNCTATVTSVTDTNGVLNLTFTVTDGALTDFETFVFTVNAVNDAPVLGAIGPQSVSEDGVATINFTISDIDSALNCVSSMSAITSNASIISVANVVFGGAQPNCTATVTPLADANGAVNLTFTTSDGVLTDFETFVFTVNAVNDAPVLGAIGPQSVSEDGIATINFAISDIDSVLDCAASMSATTSNASIVPLANVIFGGALPNCTATVTPVADANGAVNLTFTTSDGVLIDFETFLFTVNAANDAPILSLIGPQSVSEDGVATINFTIIDIDSALNCTSSMSAATSDATIAPVANVVFGGALPNCTATITPVADKNGPVNLTFTTSDGLLTDFETFVFTVNPVNDAPILNPIGPQSISEDGIATINFTISDIDSALNCTSSMSTATSNAAIVPLSNVIFAGALPNCTATVTPVSDANGVMNLTFTVSDGALTDFETFLFTVNAVNDAPILSAIGAQAAPENTGLVINFTVTDVDSVNSCSLVSLSATSSNPTLIPTANIVFGGTIPNCTATLTPVVSQNGTSNISITVADGGAPNLQDIESFVFTVTPFNDPPILNSIGAQSVNEDGVATINFTISDIDNVLDCTTSMGAATSNAAIVQVASVVFSGVLPNCTATVTPVADTNGAVNLTFTVSDTGTPIKTDFEIFVFTVNAVNDAPVLAAVGAQSTSEDAVKVINFTISDIDSALDCNTSMSAATSNAVIVPAANVVFGGTLPNCTATVTPVADANGAVNLTFTVTDGALTDFETFVFTVNAVNDAPVLAAVGAQSTNEDATKIINFTISDVDNLLDCTGSMSAITSNSAIVPAVNVVFGGTLPNCSATVTSLADANGPVNLTFTTSDGVLTDFETFVFTVNAVNDAPVLAAVGAQSTNEDAVKVINFTISDIDSVLNCTSSMSAATSNAAIVPAANVVFGGALPNCTATITPTAETNGAVNLTFTTSDGVLTDFETFVFTVNAVNDAPVLAAVGAQSTNEDAVKVINFTISDIDSVLDCTSSMSAGTSDAAIVPAANVVFGGALPNCSATITPIADANGVVNLTFTTSDGVLTDFETFVFTVNAVNDAPVLAAVGAQNINEDAVKVINFTISDIDSVLNCTSSMSAGTSNTAIVPAANVVFGGALPNCTATVTPVADVSGPVNLTFTTSDGVLTDFETFVFTVNAVNDAPVLATVGAQSTNEDTVKLINFTTTDIDSVLDCNTSMSAATSNAAIVPVANVMFGGALPNCTATVTPVADMNGAVNLTFTTSDGVLTDFETFVFTVSAVNDTPAITVTSIAPYATNEDSSALINFTITDVDNTLNCSTSMSSSTSTPALIAVGGIVFSGAAPNCTATISPETDQNGSANLVFRVTDAGALFADTAALTVTVNPVNDAPTISVINNLAVNEDTPTAALPFTIDDIDSLLLCTSANVTVTSSNVVLVPDANLVIGGAFPNCTITATPALNANGATTITVTVNDNAILNLQAAEQYVLTVNAINDVPTISSIANQAINEDTTTGALVFTIADVETGGALTCAGSVTGVSSNQSIIPDANIAVAGISPNCTITVSPGANQFGGPVTITLSVIDTGMPLPAASSNTAFDVTVNNVNDAPILSVIGNQITNEDSSLVINFTISDIDSTLDCLTSMSKSSTDTVLVPAANIVYGGTLPNCTATVTPAANLGGSSDLTFTVSDGALSDFETFTFTVNPTDDPPTISVIGDLTTANGNTYKWEDNNLSAPQNPVVGATAFNVNFTINDADTTLVCNSTYLSAGTTNAAVIPIANVSFSGTAPNCVASVLLVNNANTTDKGGVSLTFTVNDTNSTTNGNSFQIEVKPRNDNPTISVIADQAVNMNGTVVVNYTIADPADAATLIDCIAPRISVFSDNHTLMPPANIVRSGTSPNCVLTISPVAGQSGSALINVRVSDGAAGTSDFEPFLLTVNAPPTITDTTPTSFNSGVPTPVNFTIGDVESALDCTTAVVGASTNTAVIPVANIVFSGGVSAPTGTVLCTATITAIASGTSDLTFTAFDGSANTSNNASTMTSLAAGSVVVSQNLSTALLAANSSLAAHKAFTVSTETVAITVTARDTSNNLLGGGHWVVIQKGAGASDGVLSAVTDNNDGTYTATFTGTTTGTARTFNVFIDGYPLTSILPTVTVSMYAPNCLSYRNSGSVTDGTYALDSDGDVGAAAPYYAYCDMTTNGGGWTLAAVPRKGIAPFSEVSGLLSPSTVSNSRNSNIWSAASNFEFSQLRLTSDASASQFSIADFNSSKSIVGLLSTYSTYSQSNVVVGSNSSNVFVTSNIGSTCFIIRGKSLNVAIWNDTSDYMFMGFHGGSGCTVPLGLANNWDRVNVTQQWLISGYDGLNTTEGPEQTNSNVGQNLTGTDWVNLDSATLIWLR